VTEGYQLADDPDDQPDDAIEALVERTEQAAAASVPPEVGSEARPREEWLRGEDDPPTEEEQAGAASLELYSAPTGTRRVQPPDLQSIVKVPRADQEEDNLALIRGNVDPEGRVRFRLEFRVRLMDARGCATGRYICLKGESFSVDCRTEEAVEYLRRETRKFIAAMDGIVVESEEDAAGDTGGSGEAA
jgi:hypothetical protein